jgi:CubicO group peptidase (beta-lactamase class C family)
MTDLERMIEAVECGLLLVSREPGRPVQKRDLIERMKYYKVPGFSIALIDQEKVAWTRGYGVCEAGCEEPVTPGTVFQAASISKAVAAIMALRLVDQGLIDLDADVNDVLRTWKIPKSKHTQLRPDGTRPLVTLRGLLLHSAGISPAHYMGYPVGAPLPALCQILDGRPPAYPRPVRVKEAPGNEFHYSAGGYMVVQQMIEDVAGKPFAHLAKEWIFDPLGMTHSTFNPLLPEDTPLPAATAHRRDGTPVTGKWQMYPELAAAGLWSTPSDLARLASEVMKSYKNESNCILSAEMTRKMMAPQLGFRGFTIGLAFFMVIEDGKNSFGHNGWNAGFHSLVSGILETGRGFAWMANGENGQRLGFEVTQAISKEIGWKWQADAGD